MSALAMSATNGYGKPIHQNVMKFDTDSGRVGIDNRCSACISHKIDNFEGPLHNVNRAIKGFGGQRTYNVKMGTIIWKWGDNEGKIHKFRIPNSYYIPKGGIRLLSPQHWAKHKPKPELGRPLIPRSAPYSGIMATAVWTYP